MTTTPGALRVGVGVFLLACSGEGSPRVEPDPEPPPLSPDETAGLSWTLRFPHRLAQQVDVEMTIPPRSGPVTLYLPAWTPGSYVVRDYARNVKDVQVATTAGGSVPVDHPAFDRWEVADGKAGLVVRYRVHCADWSVRGCWTEDDFAVLNGAAVFLYPVDVPPEAPAVLDVRLELPDGWPDVGTALSAHPGGEPHRLRARSHDELVDSPILVGALRRATRQVGDVPISLVTVGDDEAWDMPARIDEVARILEVQGAFWGGVPFRRYEVLQVVGEGRGGLEHKASTLLISPPAVHRQRADRIAWWGLVSHEMFHAWNIKRLRPLALGPFDLTRPAPTPDLWVAEGLTSYYDDLLLARAGLIDEKEELDALSKQIRALQDTPGRGVRSLRDAGTDAWIKHYQPDADSENATISYYTKGAVVGWVLDVEVRRSTGGTASLDDVLRSLYPRYSGAQGYRPEDVRAAFVAVGGPSLGPVWDQLVLKRGEIDYAPALSYLGLRFAAPTPPASAPDGPSPIGGWLGVTSDPGPLARVRTVRQDGPAWSAGVLAGDEIVAIDGQRVEGPLEAVVARFDPGAEVALTLSRRGRLRVVEVSLGVPPDPKRFTLEPDPAATPEAVSNRRRWLWGPSESPPIKPPATPPVPDTPAPG